MRTVQRERLCEAAQAGGPLVLHFYFPGHGGGDPLLEWVRGLDVEPERIYSLNAYLNVELVGQLGLREVPAVVVVYRGFEIGRVEGVDGLPRVRRVALPAGWCAA